MANKSSQTQSLQKTEDNYNTSQKSSQQYQNTPVYGTFFYNPIPLYIPQTFNQPAFNQQFFSFPEKTDVSHETTAPFQQNKNGQTKPPSENYESNGYYSTSEIRSKPSDNTARDMETLANLIEQELSQNLEQSIEQELANFSLNQNVR